MKKILIAAAITLLIVAGLVIAKGLQFRTLAAAGAKYTPPPESVAAAVATEQDWQDTVAAVGSIAADQGVTITPEVAGKITEIRFESGATVAAGDLLVKLDTSSEEAQLRALEAQAELGRLNLERARKLRSDNTIAQSELDTAEATLKQLEANADTVRATIAKKHIRAPFAGRLGIRLVDLGENLDLGKPIVSLQSLTPVYGDFSLPQQDLARVKAGMEVHLTTDTYPERQFTGVITAINPDLDENTRMLRLRAKFANTEELLRPGMFARMEVQLPSHEHALVIPVTAVLSAPFGDSVYVIEPATNAPGTLVVRQQLIHLGRARGDFVSVTTGLKAGDRVVNAGLFKLRNGITVTVTDAPTPKASETPQPPNS